MRLILPLLFLSSPALAGDSVTFSAERVVTHGEGSPSITFNTAVSAQLDVTVRCGGGGTWSMRRTVSPGSSETLEFKGIAQGWHDCEGTVALRAEDGSVGEMTLPLRVGSLPKMDVNADESDLDLQANTLRVHPTRAVSSCELTVIGPRGVELAMTQADIRDPMLPTFGWDAGGQEVVKLNIICQDADGFISKLFLSPWQTSIPHEDVVFASNSAEIPPEEVHKLESSWAELAHAVELYGSVVDVQLFVAGYTDTVGDAGSNQALSQRRARAIGAWFRQRGFSGPVFYQGFGESVLAVPTPDQTDQAANRRVLYVLGGKIPSVSKDLPRQNWRKL